MVFGNAPVFISALTRLKRRCPAGPGGLRACSAGIFLLLAAAVPGTGHGAALAGQPGDPAGAKTRAVLAPWAPGFLDIHHINTGRGNAAFFIFPDGTTMLFDAGDRDPNAIDRYAPLKIAPTRPDDSRSPGAWVAAYIKQVMPSGRDATIDYALISHFHSDHFGNAHPSRALAPSGAYRLSGMAEVGHLIPIGVLLDRAYPGYDYPLDLRAYYAGGESPFLNYLAFAEEFQDRGKLKRAALRPGSATQIRPLFSDAYPGFEVRNVKVNADLWRGAGEASAPLFSATDVLNETGRFSENPLSLALTVRYGPFKYFTGGDNTGMQGPGIPGWYDVETPIGEVVGNVDVMNLNHHGNRDSTNANILRALAPRVIIQQSWFSDHPGGEVVHRMLSRHLWPGPRDIFSTNMAEETKVAIGPWMTKGYTSFEGHVVVRAHPGGEQYEVFVIDDRSTGLAVKSRHGPYSASARKPSNSGD